jgi:K+-transporting ATPase c subunit
MRLSLRIAIVMTLVTTMLFGLLYPLAVAGLSQFFFPAQANSAPS